MTVYLLDVNVLLALTDPAHVHHNAAHTWLSHRTSDGWSTSPITENGYVRIASGSGYPNQPGDAKAVLELLRRWCSTSSHEFWADDIRLMDVVTPAARFAASHITDVYLLGLAVSKGGKLASFDRRIPVDAIAGGRAAFELIHP